MSTCPECGLNHSNRYNCDGSKRTLDERLIGQQERLAAVHTERATDAGEALLAMGPTIRLVRRSRGGHCQLCRRGVRNDLVVVLPGLAGGVVHDNCARQLLTAMGKRVERGVSRKWGFGPKDWIEVSTDGRDL